MDQTKMNQEDLDSPRRELSNSGLGTVVALLVRWGIDFCGLILGYPIQLYCGGDHSRSGRGLGHQRLWPRRPRPCLLWLWPRPDAVHGFGC